jgi:hypothetical protein
MKALLVRYYGSGPHRHLGFKEAENPHWLQGFWADPSHTQEVVLSSVEGAAGGIELVLDFWVRWGCCWTTVGIRNHGRQGSHTLNLLRREGRRVAGRWSSRNWELETLEKRVISSTAVEERHSPHSCWISIECSGLEFTFVSRSYGAGYLEAIVPETEWMPSVGPWRGEPQHRCCCLRSPLPHRLTSQVCKIHPNTLQTFPCLKKAFHKSLRIANTWTLFVANSRFFTNPL